MLQLLAKVSLFPLKLFGKPGGLAMEEESRGVENYVA